MKAAKRKRLGRAGWRFVSTEEFLELSDEEKALVEIKLALADAKPVKTSQPRVSKFETWGAELSSQRARAASTYADTGLSCPSLSTDFTPNTS
jgi:hypothetical protein